MARLQTVRVAKLRPDRWRMRDALAPGFDLDGVAALLALVLALVALAAPWRASGVGPTGAAAVPMSRETEDSLPGLEDDPLVRKALKCNACFVVLDERFPALRMERAKKRRQLSPDEFIRTTERTCGKARAEYGLQMRNNAVTPVYSKHAAVSRAEGSWISNYIATTCGQIIGDYDAVLKEAAFGKVSWNDLARRCANAARPKTNARPGRRRRRRRGRTGRVSRGRGLAASQHPRRRLELHGGDGQGRGRGTGPGPGAVRGASESCC